MRLKRRNKFRRQYSVLKSMPVVPVTNKTNWPLRALRGLEALAAFAAICAVCAWYFVERPVISEQRAAFQDQQVVNSWLLLTTPASGNTGKGQALEFLVSKRQNMSALDLSAARNGDLGVWLTNANLDNGIFNGSNFSDVVFEYSSLKSAGLDGVNLRNAHFFNSDLSGAYLTFANLENTKFESTNISGANFEGVSGLTQEKLNEGWALIDNPPKNIPDGIEFKNFYQVTEN